MGSLKCFVALFAVVGQLSTVDSSANQGDLRRARTKVPRHDFRGSSAREAATVLNGHLKRIGGLASRECANFSIEELRTSVHERLLWLTTPHLNAIYTLAKDPRKLLTTSLAGLRAEWAVVDGHLTSAPHLEMVVRDGMCHEAVMWFVHHLPSAVQRELIGHGDFALPLLPPVLHKASPESSDADKAIMTNYNQKVSCQQCHSGLVEGDASLPPPLPVDKESPGMERLRSCDFQNKPGCGPCEGLGGPRSGDGVHEFQPINCEIIGHPDDIDKADRPQPSYPQKGTGFMSGETRWPLVLIPDGHGKYYPEDINCSFGWDMKAGVARMRYSFNQPVMVAGMKQVYLQTFDQMRAGKTTGCTITITGDGKCTAKESLGGVLHLHSFALHDEWDVVNLPASEGGTQYLGRVKINPLDDGNNNHTVIADHYLKYGFHFLLDAEKSSKTYGLPLRTYIPFGVRQVFKGWNLEDPQIAEPDMWKMPKDCLIGDPVPCAPFVEAAQTSMFFSDHIV
eukprot:TRINITY_DN55616_c0_g1_i1.p1 TRINITY_DN55616_c0_g1~~TRINITY_DN55616_c0_g1_i1.p1  ORF type:complete len:509 (-),score=61.95 TRINITY_DN55616_c0_g1_i1:78-1604(-)